MKNINEAMTIAEIDSEIRSIQDNLDKSENLSFEEKQNLRRRIRELFEARGSKIERYNPSGNEEMNEILCAINEEIEKIDSRLKDEKDPPCEKEINLLNKRKEYLWCLSEYGGSLWQEEVPPTFETIYKWYHHDMIEILEIQAEIEEEENPRAAGDNDPHPEPPDYDGDYWEVPEDVAEALQEFNNGENVNLEISDEDAENYDALCDLQKTYPKRR